MSFNYFIGLLLGLQIILTGCASVGKEFEIAFTTAEIQNAVNRNHKAKTLVDGLVVVALEESPLIRVGEPPNRIGVSAKLSIQVPGTKPLPARIVGSAVLVFVEASKTFFITEPSIESVEASFLPKALEGTARSLIANQLKRTFHETPIYVLPEDGTARERVARHLLKSIQIRNDKVVALFALL